MKVNKIQNLIIITFLIVTPLSFAVTPSEQIKIEALTVHNHFRTKHHSPKLVWDETLAQYAEKYASQCKFAHSSSAYGENLASGYPSITAAITAWYNENRYYSFQHPGYSNRTGHFTQLIWKSTTKLGCAYTTCNGKNGTPGKFLVCEYSPRGNITNQNYFKENVGR